MNLINQLLENYYSSFILFIFQRQYLGIELAAMQLVSKYNKHIRYLLCPIDLFNKYTEKIIIKTEKVLLLLMHFKLF